MGTHILALMLINIAPVPVLKINFFFSSCNMLQEYIENSFLYGDYFYP